MKKHLASFLIVSCLTAFSWAQGKVDLFDIGKSQQELEIMKGILSTTLSFVAQTLQKQAASGATTAKGRTGSGSVFTSTSWRSSNMHAFYLYGQGAVFVVPTSSLRYSNVFTTYDFANIEYLGAQERAIQETVLASREIEALSAEMARQAAGATATAKAAQAPNPPTPPKPPQANQEELRKKVAEAQDKVKKSREEAAARRANFLASLGQIKVYLVEALANHGDSLTTVKPNEYITLVLLTDDSESSVFYDESGPRTRQEIVSVQKSWITDYKAGRLTLDAFKQKALQYSE